MSVADSNQLDHDLWDSHSKKPVPLATDIKNEMRFVTTIGLASDALWHHRLRHHYIGYPRTLHTCGIYAFWACVWYCATKSGDWTHAAIANERNKIAASTVPAYDGIWDHGPVSTAYQLETKSVSRKIDYVHLEASCSLIIAPVFVRLTYAYRPWFWQRRLPLKMMWLCGAAYTSCLFLGCVGTITHSHSRLENLKNTAWTT